MSADPRARFFSLLHDTVRDGTLEKLTLGKYRGADPTLKHLFVRPVTLKAGPHLSFLWRHATRDITKNHPPAEALAEIDRLLGRDFLDAHLKSSRQTAQLETQPDGSARLSKSHLNAVLPVPAVHDRPKAYPIPADSPWLHALGVTNDRGQPREGMADKFRQIQKFAEILSHLLTEAGLVAPIPELPSALPPLRITDMGSGKGYLTFAVAALLGERAAVRGIEARPELVDLCNDVARAYQLAPRLSFVAGQIESFEIENQESQSENSLDVLIALHACDTATDDALAKGIAAGARLLVVSPCCQKEIRAQLTAPPVLADALQHGIFQERQAEFVTDALRAQLLEWAGYRTKVFEFISTEHTAKNLMIAAIRTRPPAPADDPLAARIRDFARFYGLRSQSLARQLGFALASSDAENR